MSASINKAMLLGHIGADPEVRYVGETGNQMKVVSVNLATSKKYKTSAGEIKEDTQWHMVRFYRNLADVAEKYLRKGSLVFVEGEIRHRSYVDKTGTTRWLTDILASNMQLLDRKPDPAVQGARAMAEQPRQAPPVQQALPMMTQTVENIGPDDDLPF